MTGHDDRPKIRVCHKCGWKFISPDPKFVAKCYDCRQDTDNYLPRNGGSNCAISEAIRFHRDTS